MPMHYDIHVSANRCVLQTQFVLPLIVVLLPRGISCNGRRHNEPTRGELGKEARRITNLFGHKICVHIKSPRRKSGGTPVSLVGPFFVECGAE